jgi:hypothetical protein
MIKFFSDGRERVRALLVIRAVHCRTCDEGYPHGRSRKVPGLVPRLPGTFFIQTHQQLVAWDRLKPHLLIPLRARRRQLDVNAVRLFHPMFFQPVTDLAPYLGRAVAALTKHAVDAAAETDGNGVGPRHCCEHTTNIDANERAGNSRLALAVV